MNMANKGLLVWALVLTAFVLMGVVIPNTFVPGTTITAAEMNANFAALDAAVDALEDPLRSGTVLAYVMVDGDAVGGAVNASFMSTGGVINDASVTRDSAGQWTIDITGVAYSPTTHPTTVTPRGESDTDECFAAYNMFGDDVRIRIWDETGTQVDRDFTLIIHNP